MANKITFKFLNDATIKTINAISNTVFMFACETDALNKIASSAKKELDRLAKIDTLTLSETEKSEHEKSIQAQKAIQGVVSLKRKALSTWRKESLHTTKNDADEWADGLFSQIGINSDLHDKYISCKDSNTWGAWNNTIREMLETVYGMDFKNDKLPTKLASYLEHAIGLRMGTTKDILNGVRTKSISKTQFYEIFVFALCDYMKKTCDKIIVPTVEFYDSVIGYDENLRKVVSAALVEKDSDNKDEESDEQPQSDNTAA